jgi:hypothetical protein
LGKLARPHGQYGLKRKMREKAGAEWHGSVCRAGLFMLDVH